MIRVSTTAVESFRLWRDFDWMAESDLTATILGRFTPTPAVKLGKAYHSVIEDPDRYLVPAGYACDGYAFDLNVMNPALELVDRRGTFEVKATAEIDDVVLVAKSDHISGARISEFKTTLSSFDPDKYLASFQWRAEAFIFQPRIITYHVFCLSEAPNGVIGLKSVETLHVFPYADLERDVRQMVREFRNYVKLRGLDETLRQRQREAA